MVQASPDSPWCGAFLVLLACSLAAAGGCGTTRRGEVDHRADVPLGLPVRLENVIDRDVAISRSGRLKRWLKRGDDNGAFLARPYGVAWDDDGSLLITDPGSGRLWRVGAKRKPESSPRSTFESPMGVAVCPEGIVVTDSVAGRVVLLDRRLRAVETIMENLERPTGVACSSGRLLVVETGRHRVLLLNRPGDIGNGVVPAWKVEGEWGNRGEARGEFNFPAAVTSNGRSIWIGDTLNFRVQQLDVETGRSGNVFGRLGSSPGEMPRIKGIAVDREGQLWISDAHLDQVSIFGPDGRFLMFLGGPGSEVGQFAFPAGIAAHPDGRVAVVDSLNRRVQLFRVTAPVVAPGHS